MHSISGLQCWDFTIGYVFFLSFYCSCLIDWDWNFNWCIQYNDVIWINWKRKQFYFVLIFGNYGKRKRKNNEKNQMIYKVLRADNSINPKTKRVKNRKNEQNVWIPAGIAYAWENCFQNETTKKTLELK